MKNTWSHLNPQHILQKWITTSLFALVITYFLLRVLGNPYPEMLPNLWKILLVCALLGIMSIFWKVTLLVLGGLGLLILFQFLLGFDLGLPIVSFSFWQDFVLSFSESLQWAFTNFADRGPVPAAFPNNLLLVVSIVSTLTNWILSIPIFNMFLLVAPMFYTENLTDDNRWLIFLLIGLFCIYASYASKQDTKNKEQRPPILFGAVLIALTFILQAIIPSTAFYNQALSQKLNALSPTEGGQISSFSLQELGFYPQGNLRVGGPVTLSRQPYLDIQAPATSFYLRGSAYDSFDGNSWSLSESQILESYEWDGDYYDDFDSHIAETFWFTSPENRDIALANALYKPMIYTIQTYSPTKIVFHGGKPIWLGNLIQEVPLTASIEEVIDLYSAGGEFLFSDNGMLVSTETYEENGLAILDSVVPILNNWSTETGLVPFEHLEASRGQADEELAALAQQHDPDLYEIVYELDFPFYELINQMRAHFDANYSYSLQVPNIPNGQSFMDHFLQTKEGYCVYFATAWCELLNDIGYETRYAEGFVVPQYTASSAEEQENYLFERTISAENAHAWVEVYVEGYGWYPVEATPSEYISQMSNTTPYEHINEPEVDDSQEESEESVDEVSEESVEESEESLEQDLVEEDPTEENQDKLSPVLRILLVILLILLLLGILLAIYANKRYEAYKERLNRESLHKADEKPDAMVDHIWKHIKRLNRLLGIQAASKDTIQALINTYVSDFNPNEKDRIINLLHQVYYGKGKYQAEDVYLLHDYFVYLEKTVKEAMDSLPWFIKDVLTVKGNPW